MKTKTTKSIQSKQQTLKIKPKKRKTAVDMTDQELEEYLERKKLRDETPQIRERYYVTNADLLAELIKWRDSNKEEEEAEYQKWKNLPKNIRDKTKFQIDYNKREISEELGKMFMELARKISNHSFFRNYTLETKQDMMGYAYEKLITGLPNFNFKYTNAFAYLSQVCFNAFKTTLSKHYKQVNIKRALTKKAILELDTYIPNSSITKCLNNQFDGNDFDNFQEF